jgi:Ca2+-binding RTX toxin-like protein
VVQETILFAVEAQTTTSMAVMVTTMLLELVMFLGAMVTIQFMELAIFLAEMVTIAFRDKIATILLMNDSTPILDESDIVSDSENNDIQSFGAEDNAVQTEAGNDSLTGNTGGDFVDTGDENDTLLAGTDIDTFDSLGEANTGNENTETVFVSDTSLGVLSNPEELDPNSDDEIVNSFSPTEDTI